MEISYIVFGFFRVNLSTICLCSVVLWQKRESVMWFTSRICTVRKGG